MLAEDHLLKRVFVLIDGFRYLKFLCPHAACANTAGTAILCGLLANKRLCHLQSELTFADAVVARKEK